MTAAPALRVFFAIWPDAETRSRVSALASATAAEAGGKVPQPSNLHLTLAFVGAVAPERMAALCEIGAAASHATIPFTLTLDRIGGFRDAGVAWLGADVAPPELERLAVHLHDALGAAGFSVDERPFRIHVTLARRCRRRVRATTVAPIEWRVLQMTLTVSDLGADGSHYRDVAAWPLGAVAD